MAVLPFSMYAQEGKKKSKPVERYWYIQADGGLSINHGDLANYEGGIWNDFDHFKKMAVIPTWNAHFGVGYQFGKVIGLNLKGGYGLLAGHKHGQPLSFIEDPARAYLTDLSLDKTNYIEGNLNLTFNLFNMFKYNPRRVINLVPHIGFGGIYYQAGAIYQLDENENQAETPMADQKKERELTFTVPAGMEITFNIAPKFDLFLDYTYIFTGSDKLDQMMKRYREGYYTEENRVINDKDMYSQFNLGLRVKFNNPCDIDKMARESKKITYRVNPNPLVEGEDGNVCFDVIVTIPGEYFEKKAVMNLKPYLAYNGGQIDIDPITFVGEKVKGEGDFRVNYKEGGEFTKHYCMPYQEEMANCELKADPMFYVYDGTIYPTQDEIVKNTYYAQGATVKLADGVTEKDEYIDQTVYDTIKGMKAVKKLTYFYNKDKYNINDRKKLNNEADAAFNDLLKAGVTDFKVEAWASPEGEEGHNNELSTNRDNAAEKQMNKLAKKAKTEITITGEGKGEDWATFIELVKNSDLKDKDAIVNNINNSSNKQRTVKEMCSIYPQLEKDILPQIRRAEVLVDEPYQEIVPRTIKVKVPRKH
jgi:outer membrane protein OmpA-like peptidoglycan-associated protein